MPTIASPSDRYAPPRSRFHTTRSGSSGALETASTMTNRMSATPAAISRLMVIRALQPSDSARDRP